MKSSRVLFTQSCYSFFFSFCFRFLSFYFGRIVWLEPNTHLVEFDAGGSKVKLNYGWNGELRESLVRCVGSVQVRSATFSSLLRPNSNTLLTGLFLSTLFFHLVSYKIYFTIYLLINFFHLVPFLLVESFSPYCYRRGPTPGRVDGKYGTESRQQVQVE